MQKDQVNADWLTEITGDPFTDTGGHVINFLKNLPEFKSKSIMDLIEYATDIYIDDWDAKLHPFFLNSTITQAQFIGDRKRSETLKYFNGLIKETLAGKTGFCEISGKKTKLFPAGRNNQILGGSGTFVNFHINLQAAVYLSKEVLIRMFFVPLGIHRLADKIALVISNNEKVTEYFVFQNCINNLSVLKDKTSKGPLKSIFRNPANALFRFVDDYVRHLDNNLNTDEKKEFDPQSTSLNLYHFSNLGQKPEVVLYTMDNDIFSFYTYSNRPEHKKEWQEFVRANYNPDNLKKLSFDQETKQWSTKEGEEITFEDYAKWRNFVLNALLNKFSLLKYFLKWSKYHLLPIEIIQMYQTTIRGMKKESVEKVEAVAEFIVSNPQEYMEDTISSLNNVMSRMELRKIFLKVQSLAYQQKAKAALLSAEDYVENLFHPAASWSELRDLLVISIYQKRNQNNI